VLTDYSSLTYDSCPLEAANHPPGYIGTTFVVHLISEDIYLQLTLTNWGGSGGIGDKTFGYIRSTAPPATPPSVTITNPVSGAALASPATVKIGAIASSSSATVTNVQFFTNNVLAGSSSTAPFGLSINLAAGNYALKAIAAAGGLTGASAVVNIRVVTPVTVVLSGQRVQSGQFSFNYTANPGLSYFVASSPDHTTWTSLVTNVPSSSPVPSSDTYSSTSAKFYRVGRLPNP
jgi:hypothetical protein